MHAIPLAIILLTISMLTANAKTTHARARAEGTTHDANACARTRAQRASNWGTVNNF